MDTKCSTHIFDEDRETLENCQSKRKLDHLCMWCVDEVNVTANTYVPHIHTHKYTHTHAHTHTHKHTHTHTHTDVKKKDPSLSNGSRKRKRIAKMM